MKNKLIIGMTIGLITLTAAVIINSVQLVRMARPIVKWSKEPIREEITNSDNSEKEMNDVLNWLEDGGKNDINEEL